LKTPKAERSKKKSFFTFHSVTISLQEFQLAIRAIEELFGAITPQEQTFLN
jgi:hypothetical protein